MHRDYGEKRTEMPYQKLSVAKDHFIEHKRILASWDRCLIYGRIFSSVACSIHLAQIEKVVQDPHRKSFGIDPACFKVPSVG